MRKILLIISGSIAAYKSLELIRRGREQDYEFTTILTAGGAQFITPLSAASLSGNPCYTELFSLKDETEMGHIRLSREHDLVLVVPASADLMAKVANGICDDLASTVLSATDKPVIIAPGMNARMWGHSSTQQNIQQLLEGGIQIIQPGEGALACGETGTGRMADVPEILSFLKNYFEDGQPLAGKSAIVTAGPTHEPIDPVRYLANRSSGKQGYAIAEALAQAGANVTLVSGPSDLETPHHVKRVDVKTAEQMLRACDSALPADIFVGAAAVADWRPSVCSEEKIKKQDPLSPLEMSFIANPDILAHVAQSESNRPKLVIGFAAETESLIDYAKEKKLRKGCDWIIANDVSKGKVFGDDDNTITLISSDGVKPFDRMSKHAVAQTIVNEISDYFSNPTTSKKERSHG